MTERRVSAVILAIFAIVFVGLRVYSVSQKSATFDEPVHLAAGYAALTRGDYRVDPSHPPFLRMWAALPLLAGPRPALDLSMLDTAGPGAVSIAQGYPIGQRFLFADNDGDRLLFRARLMSAVWGVLLGALLFLWTREWLGLRIAAAVLIFYTISPNLTAHAPLVTTDIGATCFIFAAVYFMWRASRRFTAVNIAGVAVATALAVVSKFSGMVLAPALVILAAIAVTGRTTLTVRRSLALAALTCAVTMLAIWAVYGFRYQPSDVPQWTFHTLAGADASGAAARAIDWIDRYHLLPNAFTRGLWLSGATARTLPVYLAGEVSRSGWWYYFPLAFLLKTPVAALALLLVGGAAVALRWRRLGRVPLLFAIVPAALYFAIAMTSGINIGVRHILPVYPFFLLISGAGAELLMLDGGRAGRVAIVVLLAGWAVEYGRVFPNSLTFFNALVGGPAQGGRYLADSNLDWGQHLKLLKQWMDEKGVSHINLAYFGSADPAYYGIDATRLPGQSLVSDITPERPTLPGYVVISETVRAGVYLPRHLRRYYRGFDALTPVVVIGNALRVYWVESWPEPRRGAQADPASLDSLRSLADYLRTLPSPTHAIRHYREYLAARPDDAGALEGLGRASLRLGDLGSATQALAHALTVDPRRVSALQAIVGAYLKSGRLNAAVASAERLCRLAPQDPASHDLRGRALAASGRIDEAIRALQHALELNPGFAPAREALQLLPRTA